MSESERRTKEQEIQRLSSLSRVFIVKAAECIYQIRCPKDLPDFSPDLPQFSLKIPQSSSLRQHISSTSFHGYLKIDISLTNPQKLIERWIIEQRPPSKKSEFKFTKEDKNRIYANFTTTLKGLFTLLNVLPAKTLDICLSHFPLCERRLTAFVTDFKSLEDLPDQLHHFNTYEMDPIETPIGITKITCQYYENIQNELPAIIQSSKSSSYSTSGSEIRQTIPAQLRDSEKEGINSMVENTFLKDPNAYQNTRATPSFLNSSSDESYEEKIEKDKEEGGEDETNKIEKDADQKHQK